MMRGHGAAAVSGRDRERDSQRVEAVGDWHSALSVQVEVEYSAIEGLA